ncbi:ABC transporter [Streptomyces lunaelactis]|uniref:ABC transporter n=2 Tax=Streptomyces lunaelactis TaxID=1535768 RepID=A0A2R4TAR9_9ACTN|nr:ABC transporter substrate-binding protein [Streptomyces lunaelactis]AVZ76228.1 ABC transporter [Streptomyces lunaelactis]NUK11257.1 ABC transporter substrate-binding protein [Streptomyces lunaelactis]NUK23268.1 ABC transporter substrate-binding protein [Streptomyces lunaelactis]NUK53752.1 ABC transporter substrate-binding protein [Streptomyces lunaelactis]NUK57671.1 ABC transporter substrate-binding protein [Streptomyces lunaelactis]
MKPKMYVAVLAVLALTVVGCSEKATNGDGGGKDAGGVKTGDGVTAKTITLGVLTDMTGVYASLGKSVTQAQQLWAKQTNASGGICGRTVELTIRDHGYDPQKAVAAYTELEPKVLGFAQFIGSPFVAAVKQRIDGQDKGLVLPQAWSASLLGSPYVRVVGATYDIETINAVDYLLTQKRIAKGDKIGHVYFEGDYGENALTGSKYAAGQAGLTVVEQKIKPTDNDMSAQVAALKKAGVKAVVISAGPRQAASLVGVAAAGGFNVPVIGNNSAFAPQLLATPAGPALMKDYYVAASTLPIGAPDAGPAKLAKEYAAAYPKDGLDNGVVAGYTAAGVYGEVLKKACADKDLTREGIDKALLTLSSYDSGFGITHDFSDPAVPSTRQSLIMKPDNKVPGGLKVVQPATVAKAAESYKAAN